MIAAAPEDEVDYLACPCWDGWQRTCACDCPCECHEPSGLDGMDEDGDER